MTVTIHTAADLCEVLAGTDPDAVTDLARAILGVIGEHRVDLPTAICAITCAAAEAIHHTTCEHLRPLFLQRLQEDLATQLRVISDYAERSEKIQ